MSRGHGRGTEYSRIDIPLRVSVYCEIEWVTVETFPRSVKRQHTMKSPPFKIKTSPCTMLIFSLS